MALMKMPTNVGGGESGIKDFITLHRYMLASGSAGYYGAYVDSDEYEIIPSSTVYEKANDYIKVNYNFSTQTITFTALKNGDYRYFGDNHFGTVIGPTTVTKSANEVIYTTQVSTATYVYFSFTCVAL